MDGDRERKQSAGSYGSGRSSDRGGQRHGGRNGRGYKPSRDKDQRSSSRSGRGKGDYMGSSGNMMKTPIILARSDKRHDPPPQMMPGAISIMQREAPGNRHPMSPPIRSVTSPAGGLLPTPTETHPPHQAVMMKPRDDHKRPQRSRTEGLSSSPSNYTPLQPTTRSLGRGEGSGGVPRGPSDHFLTQTNEMSHPVKVVDRGLHWEEKGMDFMQEQSDFLVVGTIGKQGVGKSTIMSLLAGTRTGAGKPFMFRPQSKEVWESGGFQTNGIEMIVTGERIILLDTQPVLSESLLEQFTDNQSMVPPGLTPDTYLEVLSLQMAMFLYSVCHVVVVVVDSMETSDVIFRFLGTVEQMKMACDKGTLEMPSDISEKQYFPQLVFVLNHSSPDDFQPLSLREMHSILVDAFQRSKVNIAGGVSLAKSGIVPIGRGFPPKKHSKNMDSVDPGEVNLHLIPSNPNVTDMYSVYSTSRPEKSETNLNPIFKLLTSYVGHPSYNLLAETLRNQIFAMPRPPIRKAAQQQITEREWFDYARRVWLNLKKSDLVSEYDRILQTTPLD